MFIANFHRKDGLVYRGGFHISLRQTGARRALTSTTLYDPYMQLCGSRTVTDMTNWVTHGIKHSTLTTH